METSILRVSTISKKRGRVIGRGRSHIKNEEIERSVENVNKAPTNMSLIKINLTII